MTRLDQIGYCIFSTSGFEDGFSIGILSKLSLEGPSQALETQAVLRA